MFRLYLLTLFTYLRFIFLKIGDFDVGLFSALALQVASLLAHRERRL